MSHLRKKIEKELYDNNIRIYCDFFPYIYKCLEFYDFEKGSKNFLFYYLYDNTQNLSSNIEIIKKYVLLYTDYIKIDKCKKAYNYLRQSDYKECKEKCFYGVFCERAKTENYKEGE